MVPQALTTKFIGRVQNENTSLYINAQPVRSNKRTHKVVNYAEYEDVNFDDDNDDVNEDHSFSAYSNEGNGLKQQILGKPAIKTKHIKFTETDLNLNASSEEILIPIRLDLEHNGNKIIDFFMWNLNETLITPEQFSVITCQDLELPNYLQQQITSSIKSQIEEYTNLVTIQLPSSIDLHVIINLSCNLDKYLYEDKFEWDLSNDTITPEIFAQYVVKDMGLSLEFLPAIAHSLHETILKLKKDCIEGHLPYEIRNQAVFGHDGGVRLDVDLLGHSWSPSVEELSQWEIEKREIEKERNIRRLKRESMRIEDGSFRRRGQRRKFDEI